MNNVEPGIVSLKKEVHLKDLVLKWGGCEERVWEHEYGPNTVYT
jgi:hypothetical protein